jgi:hypothetical protein
MNSVYVLVLLGLELLTSALQVPKEPGYPGKQEKKIKCLLFCLYQKNKKEIK